MSEHETAYKEISDTIQLSDLTKHFVTLVEAIEAKQLPITRLGAGIIAALLLDGAHDSRSFSRLFEIEHALVLRALAYLAAEDGFLTITRRDERTQRSFYSLSEKGEKLKAQLIT
ncbi:hypothetical protein ACI0FM_02520 [Paenochrobactrum sp. BZR 588]|uniref:hypothetical protein n=1 Tax=unclassified Paenochrobactrum TaxID=2639760 RepID=UPI003854DD76